MPSFGVEDIDNCQSINIGLSLLTLGNQNNANEGMSDVPHNNNSSKSKGLQNWVKKVSNLT